MPVIERCTAADEIDAFLKSSYVLTKILHLYLTTNMRVKLFSDIESCAYAEIDADRIETDEEGMILITNQLCCVMHSEDPLTAQVFPIL